MTKSEAKMALIYNERGWFGTGVRKHIASVISPLVA